MVLTVFAGIAEFERALIAERTHTGRRAAQAKGVRFGRPPVLSAEQVALGQRLLAEGTLGTRGRPRPALSPRHVVSRPPDPCASPRQ